MLVRLRDILSNEKKAINLAAFNFESPKKAPSTSVDRRVFSNEAVHVQELKEEIKQDREHRNSNYTFELEGIQDLGAGSESEFSDHGNSISISVLRMHPDYQEVKSDSELSLIQMVKDYPEWKEAFVIFDHDQDGFLSEQEFADVLRSLGVVKTNAQISLLFMDLVSSRDLNAPGISWDEFKTIIAEEMSKTEGLTDNYEKLRKKLELFQKDGLVDLSIMQDLLTRYAEKMSHADVDVLIKDFNKQSLKEVPFQDFASFFHSNDPGKSSVSVSEPQTVPKDSLFS